VKIREMPYEERPRERMLLEGAQSLSLRELVAIVIGSGSRGRSAMDLAEAVVCSVNSARELGEASIERLVKVDGIGYAKAARLKAAIELGRRIARSPRKRGQMIREPGDVADLVMSEMRILDREHFKVILLDAKNAVISIETVSIGTLDSSIVHPREVLKPALEKSAASIILVHNHPTGEIEPSREDILVTRRFQQCGKLLGIEVLDHIIIGDGRYRSLKAGGYFEED